MVQRAKCTDLEDTINYTNNIGIKKKKMKRLCVPMQTAGKSWFVVRFSDTK